MSQINLELQHQISQFLYREAKLLDDWKFREWLDVLEPRGCLTTLKIC